MVSEEPFQGGALRLTRATARHHHRQAHLKEGFVLCRLRRPERRGVSIAQEALRDGVKHGTEALLQENFKQQPPSISPRLLAEPSSPWPHL
ncbi:MAG: hypothetical protein P8R54_10030 [Myxococcota bacterium]|nr:hypothetical protein [Myxococcota bacterium]